MNPEKIAILGVTALIAVILAVALMSSPERTDLPDRDRTASLPRVVTSPVLDPEDQEEPAWDDLDDLIGTVRQGGARTRRQIARVRDESGADVEAVAETLGGGTYVIRSGDTFDGIARRIFGKSSYAQRITTVNPGVDPRRLQVGQKINLPVIDRPQEERNAEPPRRDERLRAGGDTARSHRVTEGEVLSTIARRYYGSSTRWRRIYDANRDLLKSPDRVSTGMHLRIP